MTKRPHIATSPFSPPPRTAPEGLRARWWREHVIRMSRPELAAALGIDFQRIYRYESMKEVPPLYRLACEVYDMLRWSTDLTDLGFDWRIDERGRKR